MTDLEAGARAGEGTVGDALVEAERRLTLAGCVSARAEARWLVEEALHVAGSSGLARREPMDPAAAARLAAMLASREHGMPLQHVIGWAPFGPLKIEVGPGVFVPRPETEGLAEVAAGLVREQEAPRISLDMCTVPRIAVDLCTGSGAIACYLAATVPGLRVLATELDPVAVATARRNGAGLGVEVFAGDLDAPLPPDIAGHVDLLVANVPYVPTAAIAFLPVDVRDHEPRLALDGGPDGLDVLRRVAALAPRWLVPGGWLVTEIGDDQGEEAVRLLVRAGFEAVSHRPDLVGRDRVLTGRLP